MVISAKFLKVIQNQTDRNVKAGKSTIESSMTGDGGDASFKSLRSLPIDVSYFSSAS